MRNLSDILSEGILNVNDLEKSLDISIEPFFELYQKIRERGEIEDATGDMYWTSMPFFKHYMKKLNNILNKSIKISREDRKKIFKQFSEGKIFILQERTNDRFDLFGYYQGQLMHLFIGVIPAVGSFYIDGREDFQKYDEHAAIAQLDTYFSYHGNIYIMPAEVDCIKKYLK